MKLRFIEIVDKQIKISDAEREVFKESIINFIWGFTGNIMTPFIVAKFDAGVIAGFFSYYIVISYVLNRSKYETWFGRWVILPIPAALGAYSAYKIGFIIINLF